METRLVWIDNKVLTKSDVISLITLFVKLTGEIPAKSKETNQRNLYKRNISGIEADEIIQDPATLSIGLTTSDQTKYTGSFDQILEEYENISSKKITEILLIFFENISESKLIINIRHSYLNKGYISVESQDKTWVNSTINSLEGFITKCKKQPSFARKFRIFIIAVIILILNFFVLNMIELFIKNELIFPKIIHSIFNKDIYTVYSGITLITMAPAILIYNWLVKHYPRIDIQTAKDFLQVKKERQKKLLMMFLLILIPTFISYLLNLL